MITTGAILHGPQTRLLRFAPAEHPVALQLGGGEHQVDVAVSVQEVPVA